MPKFFLVAFFAIWAGVAQAQEGLQYSDLYVNDYADLLDDTAEDDIRDKLKSLGKNHSIEFTVLTISRMSEHGHTGEIEPFATQLFNQWGIGDPNRNDGVLLLVSRYDRKLRIEVGSGYGLTKNDAMEDIIDDYIVPYFKRDKYQEGILRGVDEIIYELSGIPPGYENANLLNRATYSIRRFIETIAYWLFGAGIATTAFFALFYRRVTRYFPKRCPVDGSQLCRLSETEDDEHLNQGEQKEEDLRSKDYDIWVCGECNHVTKNTFKPLWSKYGACRECGYKTARGESLVIEAATRSSSGQERIDFTCNNCGEEYEVFKSIPRITRSNSSGGGGSSFGGGSSSGGGASGSW